MGRQQNNNQGGAKAYSQNEQTTLQERLTFVLGQLRTREAELNAILPPDLPFEKFHATINQALRNNPKILACTGISIVNACVKSAYDGCRLDGKEAALVEHSVNIGTRAQPKWEAQAEYFIMVRGLIKKILLAREVISMEAEVIYRNDSYRVVRGTNPEIFHEPLLEGDRGPAIAYYSVATLKGGHTTAEFMTAADVADVMKEAKMDYVWKRWPGEMGKKSVIRRHEKKLPSGRDMIDIEARELFPQFDRTAPHPQLADHSAPRARPTRSLQYDDSQPVTDFGGQGVDDREREGVVVDQRGEKDQAKPAQQQKAAAKQQAAPPVQAEEQIPANGDEWHGWAEDIENSVAHARDMKALAEIQSANASIIKAADKDTRDYITSLFTDRAADLAAGSDDGAAAGDSDNESAAGDDR